MPRLAVLFVMSLPAIASADAVAVTAGPGLSYFASQYEGDEHEGFAPAFTTTVGYRMPWQPAGGHLAVGVHGNVARFHSTFMDGSNTSGLVVHNVSYTMLAFDVALAAQYERDGVWISPWAGRHFSRATHRAFDEVRRSPTDEPLVIPEDDMTAKWTPSFWTIGCAAGVDVWHSGDSKVAVFANLSWGYKNTDSARDDIGYRAILFGLAFRR